MSKEEGCSDQIVELYSLNLEKREIAFIFLGYSGILLRSAHGVVGIDVADFLTDTDVATLDSLDLLVYTHTHYDHFNKSLAKKIFNATNCDVIGVKDVIDELGEVIPEDKVYSRSEDKRKQEFNIGEMKINDFWSVHPRPISVYRIAWGRLSIFHAGDAGYTNLGSKIKADLAFLPTGMPSPTCAPEVALAMAMDLQPKIAVPFHGKQKQLNRFKKLMARELPETEVIFPAKKEITKVSV